MDRLIIVGDGWRHIIEASADCEVIRVKGNAAGDRLPELFAEGRECFVAVEDAAARKKLSEEIKRLGGKIVSVVDRAAIVADSVVIGEGVYIGRRAAVNVGARIGDGTIITSAATIDYDAEVGAYCYIQPGVVIGSEALIGDEAEIGVGAVLDKRSVIGRGAKLPAGYGMYYI